MFAAAMELRQKKKERLTDEASMFSFICKPFLLFLLIFPSVACFRCRMPKMRVVGSDKVFGLNTLKPV
ncbi:hypothetical protein ACIXQ7_21410 [Bacteroides fragilis]